MNPALPLLLPTAQSPSIINELSGLLRAGQELPGTPGKSALK